MIADPKCPVCASQSWTILGAKTFARDEPATRSEYDRQRLRVLFEVWCPGEVEFRMDFRACETCGLVIYAPRPSAADLDEKYRFLGALPNQATGSPVPDAADQWRSRKLFRLLHPFLGQGSTILDFGGGDGRLMRDFVAAGYECSTIDWTSHSIEGVERLGATLEDLRPDAQFNAIVASHVIEHIAEPRLVLERLRRHLAPDGILYIEVPLEIWRRVPHMTEPVTHVNFFVPASLRALIEHAGYAPMRCATGSTRYGPSPTPVIRAIARNNANSRNPMAPGVAHGEVLQYLRPTRLMRIRNRLFMPATWWGALRYKIRRRPRPNP